MSLERFLKNFLRVIVLGMAVVGAIYISKNLLYPQEELYAFCWRLPYNELSVQWIHQEATNWCWAASAQMIMNYHNPLNLPWLGPSTPSQCQQVKDRFAGSLSGDCCDQNYFNPSAGPSMTGPGTDDCNRPGWPEFDRYGFDFDMVDANKEGSDWKGIVWSEIQNQICHNRPFAYSWKYRGAGPGDLSFFNGHMYVGIGFRQTGLNKDKRWVIYLDPWLDCPAEEDPEECKWHKYYPDFQEDITTQPPQYTHWRDYINIYPYSRWYQIKRVARPRIS